MSDPAALGTLHLLGLSCFVGILLLLGLIDVRTRRLPDRVVLPCLWAGLLFNASAETFASPASAILGAAAGYAVLWVPTTMYAWTRGASAFGGGDLKLAAMIGAWVGIWSLPIALTIAFLAGTCAVLPAMLRGDVRGSSTVPFGPALAIGGAAAMLTGPSIWA